MSSLGKDCYGGTINCDRLVAKNSTDPHKITGDLEVTGDLKVDGSLQIDNGDQKGLKINGNPGGVGAPQAGIELNDTVQTWDIIADSQFNLLSIGHITNGASVGADVAGVTYDPSTGKFGSYFPAGGEFRLQGIPTVATGLTSGAVWSNGGVLNIVP